jgi:hypothetical protein
MYVLETILIFRSLQLPEKLAQLSGATNVSENTTIVTANDIQHQYEDNNITASDTLHMLNYLVGQVYHSTPKVESELYGCEISGLATLQCEGSSKPKLLDEPLRAVTLAGVLVPAPWATGGKVLSLEQAKDFYTMMDFIEMKNLGLNTVQLAVPTVAFDSNAGEHGKQIMAVLEGLLQDIRIAGLETIVNLVSTADELDAIVAAGAFCSKTDGVLAMTLPSGTLLDTKTVVKAIRVEAPDLPVFIPTKQGDLTTMNGEFDEHVYGALDLSHTDSVGDVASSSSGDDRSKLFYHEATSCQARSPMEYSECFADLPLFLASGFDLSIDDCIHADEKSFKDYGQCGRFEETIHSDFWHRHRASLAARQLFAYEQGMGWSFATWKLYKNKNVGTLDEPAKLMALQDVVAAGLFPDLSKKVPAKDACLNPPKTDFILGDDTLAPSMGPPPDCGNGWWNPSTEQCDYWIPPTPAPTEACPTCPDCSIAKAAVIGALVGGLVVGGLMWKIFGKKRNEYSEIPN